MKPQQNRKTQRKMQNWNSVYLHAVIHIGLVAVRHNIDGFVGHKHALLALLTRQIQLHTAHQALLQKAI